MTLVRLAIPRQLLVLSCGALGRVLQARRRLHMLFMDTDEETKIPMELRRLRRDDDDSDIEANGSAGWPAGHPIHGRILEKERGKMLLSLCYMALGLISCAYAMVVAHIRIPDMRTYPPLPDILLDNVPRVPWADAMCEGIIITLNIMLLIIVFFHKHRCILVRRVGALFGTLYLLRSLTMLVTSLPVPSTHLPCTPKKYEGMLDVTQYAVRIMLGGGLQINHIVGCGDYIYSGHTCIVTLSNAFIVEYTPVTWYRLHGVTWLLNITAMFLVLAGHQHYTVDVVIAFFLTSRLFLYYHMMANTQTVKEQRHRNKMWYPVFSFFESKCNGAVPNEYDWPFKWKLQWLRRPGNVHII